MTKLVWNKENGSYFCYGVLPGLKRSPIENRVLTGSDGLYLSFVPSQYLKPDFACWYQPKSLDHIKWRLRLRLSVQLSRLNTGFVRFMRIDSGILDKTKIWLTWRTINSRSWFWSFSWLWAYFWQCDLKYPSKHECGSDGWHNLCKSRCSSGHPATKFFQWQHLPFWIDI